MTRVLRMTAVALAAAFVAVTTVQPRALAQTPRPTAAPVLVLLGCVERVAPATPASNPTAPVVPTFKIMDVQPGGAGQKPTTLATEYLVVGPDTIQFSKFQNQWVEVTGSITAAPAATPPARGQRAALSTFTVTALKVVSNECKGSK